METAIENSVIAAKTRELCETIVTQPEFQNIRRGVEAFMQSEEARSQYEQLSSKGEYLQHKQQQGVTLSGDEINEYESLRTAFLNNPVARGFLDAQQTMHTLQDTIGQYVSKTFELGRVPTAEDMDHGSCGHGCGCSH
jgi:cell fate (sporulation/competence/biofilm development) regulator YlbF (YheA/YmcA/DUF963 family)